MKHEGLRAIRLGDATTHGGQVITATGPVLMGRAGALAGDMTRCPQCNGDFPITPDGTGAAHQGRACAYENDLTACGARLIASL